MKFSYIDAHGAEICAVSFEHLWADVYGLKDLSDKNAIPAEIRLKPVSKAIDHFKQIDAGQLLFRLDFHEGSPDPLSQKLPAIGFTKAGERVEFRCSLSQLPNDQGTPFRWNSAAELNWPLEALGDLLCQITRNDPEGAPEDPLIYMDDWLNDPVLTSGLQCVHIGFLEEQPAALLVAQVNPRSKWSRITYMGLTPQASGVGLGQWVHRKGFVEMRKLGGEIYHGGTSTENLRMIRLFEKHGCPVHRKMEEWIFGRSSR